MTEETPSNTTKTRQSVFGPNWFKGIFGLAIFFSVPYVLNIGANLIWGPARHCPALIPDLIKISKDNSGGLLNFILIDVVEVKEITKNDYALDCIGLGIFSNGTKQKISFRQYEEYDKYWVSFEEI